MDTDHILCPVPSRVNGAWYAFDKHVRKEGRKGGRNLAVQISGGVPTGYMTWASKKTSKILHLLTC